MDCLTVSVVHITLRIGGLSNRVSGKCISCVLSYMPPLTIGGLSNVSVVHITLTIGGLSNRIGGSYNFENWWTV